MAVAVAVAVFTLLSAYYKTDLPTARACVRPKYGYVFSHEHKNTGAETYHIVEFRAHFFSVITWKEKKICSMKLAKETTGRMTARSSKIRVKTSTGDTTQSEIFCVRAEAIRALKQIERNKSGSSLELMRVVSNLQTRLRYASHGNYGKKDVAGVDSHPKRAPYISWMDARSAQRRLILERSRSKK